MLLEYRRTIDSVLQAGQDGSKPLRHPSPPPFDLYLRVYQLMTRSLRAFPAAFYGDTSMINLVQAHVHYITFCLRSGLDGLPGSPVAQELSTDIHSSLNELLIRILKSSQAVMEARGFRIEEGQSEYTGVAGLDGGMFNDSMTRALELAEYLERTPPTHTIWGSLSEGREP